MVWSYVYIKPFQIRMSKGKELNPVYWFKTTIQLYRSNHRLDFHKLLSLWLLYFVVRDFLDIGHLEQDYQID